MHILLPTLIEGLAALILPIFHGGGMADDVGYPGSRHTPAAAETTRSTIPGGDRGYHGWPALSKVNSCQLWLLVG